MEQWRKDGRKEVIMVDLEALVPKDHLLRKIEKVMDYEWLYERLEPYYCHDNFLLWHRSASTVAFLGGRWHAQA